MLRSLVALIVGVCIVCAAGCQTPRLKKEVAALKGQLATCEQGRTDLTRKLAQLRSDYLVQSESLKDAQAQLRELAALRQALEEEKAQRDRRLQELKALVRKVSGMQLVSRPEGDFIVIENKILFAPGKIDLGPEARKTLDETVVSYLKKRLAEEPDQQVRIDGHTDGVPITHSDWESNYHLAAMRAHAVMKYLASKGIPQKNMYIVGFGPNRPLVPPPSPQADVPENRRVEILLVPKAARNIDEILEKFRQ